MSSRLENNRLTKYQSVVQKCNIIWWISGNNCQIAKAINSVQSKETADISEWHRSRICLNAQSKFDYILKWNAQFINTYCKFGHTMAF